MSARILVVDDEPDMQALVLQKFRHQIRDGTWEFLFAQDGVEALAALEVNRNVDLVVSDINMPRMDGLELLQQIRTVDPDVPFLMITGTADIASVGEAKAAGVTAYIKKPFSADGLKSKLTIIGRIIKHRQGAEMSV